MSEATAKPRPLAIRKIAINGRFLTQPVTGVQRYAREIVAAMDELVALNTGLHIRILTPPLKAALPRLRNVKHEAVGRFQGHVWEQFELPRAVGEDECLFCPGNTAPLGLLRRRAPLVVTVHDLSYLYHPSAYSLSFRLLYNFVLPRVLRLAPCILTVSEAERAAILSHYPVATGRIVAIPNGSLPGDAEPTDHIGGDEPFVLYVGSLSKRKNFLSILEVAKRLAATRGLKFVFVGGVSPSLRESLVDVPADVSDRLRFVGQVNDWSALADYYRRASCFFFPSLYESSGLPPLEAMGCGCPVVASAIPALEERCGDAALYCDPRSVDDMVAAIQRVLDDPELARRLRQVGFARARQFTWRRCAAESLEQILRVSSPVKATQR